MLGLADGQTLLKETLDYYRGLVDSMRKELMRIPELEREHGDEVDFILDEIAKVRSGAQAYDANKFNYTYYRRLEEIYAKIRAAQQHPTYRGSILSRTDRTTPVSGPSAIPEIPGYVPSLPSGPRVTAPPMMRLPSVSPEFATRPSDITMTRRPGEIGGDDPIAIYSASLRDTGDPSSVLVTPGPGEVKKPLLSASAVGSLVDNLFGAWSTVEQAKMKAALIKRQQSGQNIYLPPAVDEEIEKRKFPWIGVGAIAGGALALLLVMR